MIKRTSLVWKRPELSREEFRKRWLGEHVEYARQLSGLREYIVDFVTEGPVGAPDGIATLRFETREALDAALRDPKLKEDLTRTRESFAASVQVTIVEEHVVIAGRSKGSR